MIIDTNNKFCFNNLNEILLLVKNIKYIKLVFKNCDPPTTILTYNKCHEIYAKIQFLEILSPFSFEGIDASYLTCLKELKYELKSDFYNPLDYLVQFMP